MFNKSTPPNYITFEDPEVWRIICGRYGDTNETVITEGENNTVNITVTLVQRRNTTVIKRTIISTQENVDNSQGDYTVGTTTEPVGITKRQCAAVTGFPDRFFLNNKTIVSFNELKYFTNLHEISYQCFDGCSNLTDIDLVNVTRYINCAFRNASKVVVHNFSAPTYLGSDAFQDSGITYIDYSNYTVVPTVAIKSKLVTVTLNPNTTSIPGSFLGCSNLENINVPDTVTNLGNMCFSGCNKIKLYKLPDSLKTTGYRIFGNCPNLLYAGFMNTDLTTFGGDLVRKGSATPKLIGITLPNTVTSVALANFVYTPKFLRCYATTPPTATNTVSGGSVRIFENIYVPDDSVDLYKAANIWSNYANIIHPMSQWTTDAQTNNWQDVQSGLVWDRVEE